MRPVWVGVGILCSEQAEKSAPHRHETSEAHVRAGLQTDPHGRTPFPHSASQPAPAGLLCSARQGRATFSSSLITRTELGGCRRETVPCNICHFD